MVVFDQAVAVSQTPYGVPVEPPARTTTAPATPPTTNLGGPEIPRGSAGGSLLRFTPMITVSERYDSNVFQAPNQEVYDYVTNISPGARIQYENDLIVGSFLGNLFSEIYALNPGLNYVGGNGAIQADLSYMVGRILRGATFHVTDSFMYTPQLPAFAAPQTGNQVPAEFVRGVQVYRNNALSNGISLQAGYAVTPRLSANVLYSYSILRFLEDPDAQAGAALFNTTTQSITAGPQYNLSRNDTVGVSYQYQHLVIEPTIQAGAVPVPNSSVATTVHGAAATWRSLLTPTLTLDVAPGVAVVSGSNDPVWTARAQVTWTLQSTSIVGSYTRGVYPLFYLQGGVAISDMVAVMASHNLTDKWTIRGNANYAMNKSIVGEGSENASASNYSSKGYGVGFSAMYQFNATMFVEGSVTRSEFRYESGGVEFQFPRNIVMLLFRKEWR